MLLGTITCRSFQCINTLCTLQQALPKCKSSIQAWNGTAGGPVELYKCQNMTQASSIYRRGTDKQAVENTAYRYVHKTTDSVRVMLTNDVMIWFDLQTEQWYKTGSDSAV